MAKEPKWPKVPETKYESAAGPIPPDNFDDDLPFGEADTSPGSLADETYKKIKAAQDKAKK